MKNKEILLLGAKGLFRGKKEPWWKSIDSLWDLQNKLGELLFQLEGRLTDLSVSPQEDYKKKKGKKHNKKVVS